jgi:membrane protein implicated in regulation of membrane protease activity
MTPIAQLLLIGIPPAAGAIGAMTRIQSGNVAYEFTLFIIFSIVVGA